MRDYKKYLELKTILLKWRAELINVKKEEKKLKKNLMMKKWIIMMKMILNLKK